MHPFVQQAIDEIRSSFPSHTIESADDGSGGAYVRVHELEFGEQYTPSTGWITFHLKHTYPHDDVYPHHLPPGLTRKNTQPLGEAFHVQDMQLGPFKGSTTTVSRRSNRWNPAQDSAALKLRKVLDWVRSRL
ncbi:MAG: hypothetical protein U0936_24335 [Planctomycetaceae bacterium]